MYFIVRFDWNKIDCTRSSDRIVGYFDTLHCAQNAIKILPYDQYRNAVAIVRFPKNQIISCAEPDAVYVADDEGKYVPSFDRYIGNQYFYM